MTTQPAKSGAARVIDGHIHMYDDFRPIPDLFADMRNGYREAGFGGVALMNDTSAGVSYLHKNLLSFLYKAFYPDDTVYVFSGLDYFLPGEKIDRESFLTQAVMQLSMGASGFKFYEGKPSARKAIGNRSLLDESYAPFFQEMERRRVPIALHIGDPPYFWDPEKCDASVYKSGWFFGDSSYATYEEILHEALTLFTLYPNLPFIVPQFGYLSDRPKELEKMLTDYPAIFFDTGPTGELYEACKEDASGLLSVMEKYSDRFLFACTGVAKDQTQIAPKANKLTGLINKLLPDPSARAKVFYGNFQKLCGDMPKIDKGAVCAYLDFVSNCLAKCPDGAADYGKMKVRVSEIKALFARLWKED